jgi:PKD repeat protein
VTFDASASTGPGGTIDDYSWDLDGNGTFETDTHAVDHVTTTYFQPQTLDVGLQVTSGAATDTTTQSLTVVSNAPTASFTASPTPTTRGTVVSFDGSASTDAETAGGIASYAWDFGDGTTDQTTAPTTTHSYAALGSFNVQLVVTDADDGADSAPAIHSVTVDNVAPVAQLTFSPTQPQTGQTVAFSAAGSSDSDGSIAVYRWDLDGDGLFETVTGSQPTASRTYSTASTFHATVQVQDNDGAIATATVTVPVTAAAGGGSTAPPDGGSTAPPGSGTPPSRSTTGDTPATPGSSALKLTFTARRTVRLRDLIRRGLAASVTCGRPCTVKVTLRIPRSLARRLKTRQIIGTARVSVTGSGAKRIRVRLTRKARQLLRRSRRFTLTMTGSAFDGAGHSSSAKKTIVIKR